jgi:lysozyme family protein
MISRYNEFLLEKEFKSLLDEMFLVLESEGKWTSDNTYEWDFSEKERHHPDWIDNITNRVRVFLKKIPKEKVKEYFVKLMNSLLNFPDNIRKKILVGYLGAFLTITNIGYLTSKSDGDVELNSKIENEIKNLIKKIQKKSSFQKAQKLVKGIEAGYSGDKKDLGNWIEIPGYGQRFVGTNHGISAPVLKEWLGRYPKKEDMLSLTYEEALEIYKNKYWSPQNLSYFENQSIANLIYDGCVNQGIGAMSEILIESYKKGGLEISESPFSTSSIELANSLDQEKLFNDIKYLREKKYKKAKTWITHGKGWLKRLRLITFQDSENKKLDLM